MKLKNILFSFILSLSIVASAAAQEANKIGDFANIETLANTKSRVFFKGGVTIYSDSPILGQIPIDTKYSLWSSDGHEAIKILDSFEGFLETENNGRLVQVDGNNLYFGIRVLYPEYADNPTLFTGARIYKSDGTIAGTEMLLELRGVYPESMQIVNNHLVLLEEDNSNLFGGSKAILQSFDLSADGIAPTKIALNGDSNFVDCTQHKVIKLKNNLFFNCVRTTFLPSTEQITQDFLLTTDGTASGTKEVVAFDQPAQNLISSGNFIYYLQRSDAVTSLWRANENVGSAQKVVDLWDDTNDVETLLSNIPIEARGYLTDWARWYLDRNNSLSPFQNGVAIVKRNQLYYTDGSVVGTKLLGEIPGQPILPKWPYASMSDILNLANSVKPAKIEQVGPWLAIVSHSNVISLVTDLSGKFVTDTIDPHSNIQYINGKILYVNAQISPLVAGMDSLGSNFSYKFLKDINIRDPYHDTPNGYRFSFGQDQKFISTNNRVYFIASAAIAGTYINANTGDVIFSTDGSSPELTLVAPIPLNNDAIDNVYTQLNIVGDFIFYVRNRNELFSISLDDCPDDNLKTNPGICGCGIADKDTDNDGTPDCVDLCPSDLLKVDPLICGCGTADTDSDNDGTADCLDLCPSDPLKVNPLKCGCGVSESAISCVGLPAPSAPKFTLNKRVIRVELKAVAGATYEVQFEKIKKPRNSITTVKTKIPLIAKKTLAKGEYLIRYRYLLNGKYSPYSPNLRVVVK